MKLRLHHIILGVTAFTASAAMADVTFFETDNFGGRQFTVDRPVPNFGAMGFNDRAQSAIVDGGPWEVCGDYNFGGGCSILAPGRYPTLGGLSGRVSSARPVGTSPVAVLPPSGSITFYETENFGGRQITADRPLVNFAAVGFNDRAQSAMVEGRPWEVCIDANFGGGCSILAPGRYPTLGGMSDRISSARPASPPVAALQPPVGALPAGGAVIFYETENFGGRQFTINQPLSNFVGSRFNDRAQSVIVEGSAWEICVDADFRGDCRIFVPGRYPTLGGLGGRVSSARPSYNPRGEPPRDRMRGRAGATLFAGPNLTGRAFSLGGEGEGNLEGLFNDQASSLRVDRGYWIFCSDANFRGECHTFGPGEYPLLPPDLNHRISSGRRISNDYPYTNNPTWR